MPPRKRTTPRGVGRQKVNSPATQPSPGWYECSMSGGAVEIKLSAATALAPSRIMTANAVGVEVRQQHCELLFGQMVADACVGLLVVTINKSNVRRALESMGAFVSDLRSYVERVDALVAVSETTRLVCDRAIFESSTLLLMAQKSVSTRCHQLRSKQHV
jgi:hypothetical protein